MAELVRGVMRLHTDFLSPMVMKRQVKALTVFTVRQLDEEAKVALKQVIEFGKIGSKQALARRLSVLVGKDIRPFAECLKPLCFVMEMEAKLAIWAKLATWTSQCGGRLFDQATASRFTMIQKLLPTLGSAAYRHLADALPIDVSRLGVLPRHMYTETVIEGVAANMVMDRWMEIQNDGVDFRAEVEKTVAQQ